MNVLPRLLMLLAVLFLSSLYFIPLWQISLFAPQYPDGVTMYIFIDKIGGAEPGTLQNVNILNHYIGMKPIDPASIPELQYFPIIIGALILLGLVFIALNKRRLYLSWVVIFVFLSILGFYDFYLWEYDYGHSLAADAPIKIPGTSFQPPLFGWKSIINFEAYSGPQLGGWFAGCAILCAFFAYLTYRKPQAPNKSKIKVVSLVEVATLFAIMLFTVSCQVKPAPMYYGADVCASCKMTIVDQQHAAQLVTTKGKVFKYDAIECMLRAKNADEEYQVILVNNYLDPGKLMEAKTATFLVSPAMPSPMGANLSALPTEVEAEALQNRVGGELFSWDEIRQNIISIHVSSN